MMRRLVCLSMLFLSFSLKAKLGLVPFEYESQGGYSVGLNNGGTTQQTGLGSIRGNPGMLAAEKKYELNASYMWPSSGREVYQFGAVDSVTSVIALGVLYTGHRQDFTHYTDVSNSTKQKEAFYSSALTRRIAAGVGFDISGVSLGFGGGYVSGKTQSKEDTSGLSLNLGAAYTPTRSLRFGLAVENLLNEKIKELSPRVLRAGATYRFVPPWAINLDYAQRQRVPQDNNFETELAGEKEAYMSSDEKTLILSSSYTFVDMITLALGYGHSFDESQRKSMAGSVSFSKSGLYLSYSLRRPYFSEDFYNHTVHASYHINL